MLALLLIATASLAADDPAIAETARRMHWDLAVVKEFYLSGCDSGKPREQAICGAYALVQADMKLNDLYVRLGAQLASPRARHELVAAQRAWIAYRDKTCAFEADGYRNGQDFSGVVMSCKARHTEQRTAHLAQFLDCGDSYGCPGVD
jgi:uncharacterized protein YecT (DUF1311 family)